MLHPFEEMLHPFVNDFEPDGLPPIISMDEFLVQKLGPVTEEAANDTKDDGDDMDALRAYVDEVHARWIARRSSRLIVKPRPCN